MAQKKEPYRGKEMLNLDVAGLTNLSELLSQSSLLHGLAAPAGAFVFLALLLWSGCIRQRMMVNILAFGIMMPLVQLCMMTVGAHIVAGPLQLALLNLMPTWLS